MINPKKKLCKIINDCNKFRQGNCQFSHDKCTFGPRCRDKSTCRFFHPQNQQQNNMRPVSNNKKFQSPIGQTPCRFGDNCFKKKQGKCPFKHDDSNPPQNTFRQNSGLCRFGDKCIKKALGTCRFKHDNNSSSSPSNQFQSTNSFHSQPRQQIFNQPPPPREVVRSPFEVFEKLCTNFIFGIETDKDRCNLLHQFILSKSIKRVLIAELQMLEKVLFFNPGNSQNPFIIFHEGDNLSFYENKSVDLLASHQSNKTHILSKVCQNLKLQFIYKLEVISDGLETLLMIATKNMNQNQKYDIYLFNPKKGQIKNIASSIQEAIGVIFLNKILYILFKGLGLRKFTYQSQIFEIKEQNYESFYFQKSFTFISKLKTKVMDKYLFCAGNSDGQLYFIPEEINKLEFKSLSVCPGKEIKSICSLLHQYKLFILTVTVNNEVYLTNISTLSSQSVLQVSNREPNQIQQIAESYGHVFLTIKNVGVFVYQFAKFNSSVGLLACGEMSSQIDVDQFGNILLLNRIQQKSVVHIFKAKKNQ